MPCILTAVLLLLSLFVLSACQENFLVQYDGRKMTVEELSALFEASIETEAEKILPEPVRFGEGDVSEADRLYWTEGGSVWHTMLSCSHLADKSNIYYGTYEEAVLVGKTRCCASCEKKDN